MSDNKVVHVNVENTGKPDIIDHVFGCSQYHSEVVLDNGSTGRGKGDTEADAISRAISNAQK